MLAVPREAEQRERGERDELAELRAQRDRWRAVLDSYPAETAREILRLEGRAAVERQDAEGDAWRAGHWQGVYEDLGVLRRRGQDGREARERADQFTARAEKQRQHAEQLDHQARALADSPDGPGGWERQHPAARERRGRNRAAGAVEQRTRQPQPPATGWDRGGAHQELAWLRSERDRLRELLRGYPHHHARDAEQAERRAEQADRAADEAEKRAEQAQREYAELGRLARRGQRGTQAQQRARSAQDRAQQHAQRARSERQAAREARERPDGPVEWDRQHPGVRERLAIYEDALELASAQQAQRAVAISVGRDPAVRVLGPRPITLTIATSGTGARRRSAPTASPTTSPTPTRFSATSPTAAPARAQSSTATGSRRPSSPCRPATSSGSTPPAASARSQNKPAGSPRSPRPNWTAVMTAAWGSDASRRG